jgi:hypothetical protein
MLRQRLREAQAHFDHIKLILRGCSRAREQAPPHGLANGESFGTVDIAYWKAYDHCAAVVRCYATFERFIVNAVDEWVRWSLTYHPEPFLKNETVRALYESGLAEIFRRRSTTRFASLDRARLAQGVMLLYEEPIPVNPSLPLDPFFAAQPNLTLNHVSNLFKAIGLGDPHLWVAECAALQELCAEEGFGVEEELKQLVERRNEAAHGNGLPSEILGTNDLLARVELFAKLCESLSDFILVEICRAELGEELEDGALGRVSHVWPNASAFELTATRATFYVDLPVAMLGRSVLVLSKINSIQVEGVPTLGFTDGEGTALGIRMPYIPVEGMQMIDTRLVRGFDALTS